MGPPPPPVTSRPKLLDLSIFPIWRRSGCQFCRWGCQFCRSGHQFRLITCQSCRSGCQFRLRTCHFFAPTWPRPPMGRQRLARSYLAPVGLVRDSGSWALFPSLLGCPRVSRFCVSVFLLCVPRAGFRSKLSRTPKCVRVSIWGFPARNVPKT